MATTFTSHAKSGDFVFSQLMLPLAIPASYAKHTFGGSMDMDMDMEGTRIHGWDLTVQYSVYSAGILSSYCARGNLLFKEPISLSNEKRQS